MDAGLAEAAQARVESRLTESGVVGAEREGRAEAQIGVEAVAAEAAEVAAVVAAKVPTEVTAVDRAAWSLFCSCSYSFPRVC